MTAGEQTEGARREVNRERCQQAKVSTGKGVNRERFRGSMQGAEGVWGVGMMGVVGNDGGLVRAGVAYHAVLRRGRLGYIGEIILWCAQVARAGGFCAVRARFAQCTSCTLCRKQACARGGVCTRRPGEADSRTDARTHAHADRCTRTHSLAGAALLHSFGAHLQHRQCTVKLQSLVACIHRGTWCKMSIRCWPQMYPPAAGAQTAAQQHA